MVTDDLGARGRRLWEALLAQDRALSEPDCPMREVALTACRTADRVELLEVQCALVEPVHSGGRGLAIHPLFAEVRQQSVLLARLVTTLRLPDAASGKRPQRRGTRGTYQPPRVGSVKDRLQGGLSGLGA